MSDDQLPRDANVRLQFTPLKAVDETDIQDLMMPMAFVDARTVKQWEKTKSAIAKSANEVDCD